MDERARYLERVANYFGYDFQPDGGTLIQDDDSAETAQTATEAC